MKNAISSFGISIRVYINTVRVFTAKYGSPSAIYIKGIQLHGEMERDSCGAGFCFIILPNDYTLVCGEIHGVTFLYGEGFEERVKVLEGYIYPVYA